MKHESLYFKSSISKFSDQPTIFLGDALSGCRDGAILEGKDNEGQTVLHLAAEYGSEILVDLLLKNNANVKQMDHKRNSVQRYAFVEAMSRSPRKLFTLRSA